MAKEFRFSSSVIGDEIIYGPCVESHVKEEKVGRRKRKSANAHTKKSFLPIKFTNPCHDSDDDQVEIPKKIHFEDIKFSKMNSSETTSDSTTTEQSNSHSASSQSSADETECSSSSQCTVDDTSEEFVFRSDFEFPESFVFNDDEEKPLYSGSSISLLSAVSVLMAWFASYPGISKTSFSHLLYILHKMILPSDNSLPSSYASAQSLVHHFVVTPTEYHACINDCVLYRNDLTDSTMCPSCGSDRYQDKSQTPRKRYKYIPLLPRIKKMFASARISELLQAHSRVKPIKEVGYDIHDSRAWKSWYSLDGYFGGDARCLTFALCTDGLNPFAKEKSQYSMWPIMLNVLNYPSSIRTKAESLMLVGIIPGPKEPKSIDTYLAPLVDDLNELSSATVFDAFKHEYFTPKANILVHILDYPGQNKVFHCHGAGAYAGCVYCRVKGEYSSCLNKIVYLEHRRFLNPDDPLHDDDAHFPHKADKRYPPALKNMEFIDKHNEKYVQADTNVQKKELSRKSGCKGHYILRSLPEHDRIENTPVEPMHLIKNIAEHLVRLLSGHHDSHKVREEERFRGRFKSCWVSKGSHSLPPAPFTLTKEQMKCANSRANSIRVPSTIEWKARDLFSASSSMKSHELKEIICSGILKFCVRGMLGTKQQATLFSLCDVLTRLYSYDVIMTDELEMDVHHALALVERDFPVSLNTIVFHLLHHLPFFIRRFGPLYNYWMYPFERFNSWISRRIQNRRYPEATVIETYRLFEWSIHLQISGKLPNSFSSCFSELDEASCSKTDKPILALLSDEEVNLLDQCYRWTISEYSDLCKRYDMERDSMEEHEHLPRMSEWTPLSGPPLSERAKLLCHGPSNEIMKFNVYASSFPNINLTSQKASTSSVCSSIVSTRCFGDLYFGSIQYIFTHDFCGDSYVLAYVTWYGKIQQDVTSSLSYIYTDSCPDLPSIVCITELSGPFVTAIDSTFPNKMWIINYNEVHH